MAKSPQSVITDLIAKFDVPPSPKKQQRAKRAVTTSSLIKKQGSSSNLDSYGFTPNQAVSSKSQSLYNSSPVELEGSKKEKEKNKTQTLYATSASEIKTSKNDEALERSAYKVSASPKTSLTKAQSESTLTKAKPTSYAEVLSYSLANSSSTASSHLTHSSSASERPRSSSIIQSNSSASYASTSEEIKTQTSDETKKTPYIASQEFLGKKTTPYNSSALTSSSSKSSMENLYIRDSDIKALKKVVQNTFKVITHASGSDESTEAITLSSHRDWNSEYQSVIKEIKGTEHPSSKAWFGVSSLAQQFVDTAELYSKIIISELCLPVENKTIKPIDIGGVAGGQKFIHQGILFKLAVDQRIVDEPDFKLYMYGGESPDDDAAMKSAKNELRGLESHKTTHTSGLNYPLMAVIDYKGYRIIAMSMLPINKETLKYGSGDSGVNVLDEEPELNELMKLASERMNLKGHMTGLRTGSKKLIYGPGDIEGHVGTDGKYYVVDFGRLMPPEDPMFRNSHNKRDVFFHLLRPEFVKIYKTPLCSDAFTNWNSDDDKTIRDNHNAEVSEATKYLYEVLIPQYARYLDTEMDKFNWNEADETKYKRLKDLLTQIHAHGLNFRHIGFIRLKCLSASAQQLMLSAAAARTLKDELRRNMRAKMKDVQVPSDDPFKEEICALLNKLLFCDVRDQFVNRDLKEMIKRKYIKIFNAAEETPDYDVLSHIDLRSTLFYLFYITGIKLKKNAKHQLIHNIEEFSLVQDDIKSIETNTQHVSWVYFSDGMYLLEKSLESNFYVEDSACGRRQNNEITRQLETSVHNFCKAAGRAPNCPMIVLHYGRSLTELGIRLKDRNRSKELFGESKAFYERSLFNWPGYTPALLSWSDSLQKQANYFRRYSNEDPSLKEVVKELLDTAEQKKTLANEGQGTVNSCWKVKRLS